jgi:hypothetical protein
VPKAIASKQQQTVKPGKQKPDAFGNICRGGMGAAAPPINKTSGLVPLFFLVIDLNRENERKDCTF